MSPATSICLFAFEILCRESLGVCDVPKAAWLALRSNPEGLGMVWAPGERQLRKQHPEALKTAPDFSVSKQEFVILDLNSLKAQEISAHFFLSFCF